MMNYELFLDERHERIKAEFAKFLPSNAVYDGFSSVIADEYHNLFLKEVYFCVIQDTSQQKYRCVKVRVLSEGFDISKSDVELVSKGFKKFWRNSKNKSDKVVEVDLSKSFICNILRRG